MSEIVVSDKFADVILVFLFLRGDSLRLRYLRCFATSSSAPTWTSSIFVCFLVLSICYLQISVRMRHVTFVLDNEAIELEFISVLIYYTYKRKLEKEESMMCRNDKGRVDPKWKTQQPQLLI